MRGRIRVRVRVRVRVQGVAPAQRVAPHHARPYAAQRRLLGGKVDGTQQRGQLGHLVRVSVSVSVRVRVSADSLG